MAHALPTSPKSGSSAWWVVVLLLLLTTVAVTLRTWPLMDLVLQGDDDVRLLGVDAYYHLRHARFTAKHFPKVQRWDVGTHFPRGQRSDATGLFALTIAAATRLTGDEADRVAAARAAAWLPVVLFALIIPACYRTCRCVASPWMSLVGCALLILYPGPSLPRSVLGFADHHVAEMLLALLTVLGLLRLLQDQDVPWVKCWQRPAVYRAAPLIAFLFTWAGAPLYILLAGATLLVVLLWEFWHGIDGGSTVRAAVRYGLAVFVCATPIGLLCPNLILSPTKFWAALWAMLGVSGGMVLLEGTGRWLLRNGMASRRVSAALCSIVIVVAVGAFFLIPKVQQWCRLGLVTKDALVQEHFAAALLNFWANYGAGGFFALASWPLVAERAWRDDRARLPLAMATAGGLILLTSWSASDYEYVAAIFIPVLAVVALVELAPLLRGDFLGRWLPVGLALLLIMPVWPMRWAYPPLPGESQTRQLLRFHDGWKEAMTWMRNHTKEPTIGVDALVEPWGKSGYPHPKDSYGVLTAWEWGNFVAAEGERFPLWSRWPRPQLSSWLVAEEAEAADRLLANLCEPARVRYIVVDDVTASEAFAAHAKFAGKDWERYQQEFTQRVADQTWVLRRYGLPYKRSMVHQLYYGDGASLSHYRLVYESPDESAHAYLVLPNMQFSRISMRVPEQLARAKGVKADEVVLTPQGVLHDVSLHASVKIFERVEGALLTGEVPAGSTVTVALQLKVASTGRVFTYRQTVNAAEGGFTLRVPYPTKNASETDVRSLGPYQLEVVNGGKTLLNRQQHVEQEQVRCGEWVKIDQLTSEMKLNDENSVEPSSSFH